MEVNSAELYEIDAFVIGNNEAIECGITADAYFMQVLSSTLYKNPLRAMIREVICNAWDAHLEAGIDAPIEVTITETELIIKDWGLGIPHDQIGPIYGVYGASTKRQTSTVTGGFGLGCKSPWSYTDSFTVISCNQGKRSVYQMLRASEETEGKPCIKPLVVGIPTTDSGLTVKIPIKQNDLYSGMLQKIVKEFTPYGRLDTVLNGVVQEKLDRSKIVNDWMLCNEDFCYSTNRKGAVKVVYGDVGYDFDLKDISELQERVADAVDFYEKWLGTKSCATLILFAEPNTITPAPSRDMLSNTSLTINTITKLLKKFLKDFDSSFFKEVQKSFYVKMGASTVKQIRTNNIAYNGIEKTNEPYHITDFKQLSDNVGNIDLYQRFYTLKYTKLSKEKYIHKFSNICINKGVMPKGWMLSGDPKRNITMLFRAFKKAGVPFDKNKISLILDGTYYRSDAYFEKHDHYPYFITSVILSVRGTISERKDMLMRENTSAYCIKTSNKDNEFNKLKLAFESLGLFVLVQDTTPEVKNKSTPKSLLGSTLKESFFGTTRVGSQYLFYDRLISKSKYDIPYIESLNNVRIDSTITKSLIELFGDLGEQVYTVQHIKTRQKKNIPNMKEWLVNHIDNVILKDPSFITSIAKNLIIKKLKTLRYYKSRSLKKLIQDHEIAKAHGFTVIDLDKETEPTNTLMFNVWHQLHQQCGLCNDIVLDPNTQKIIKFIEHFDLDPFEETDSLFAAASKVFSKNPKSSNDIKLSELYKQVILLTYFP